MSRDERDGGGRRVLNFGHTFGHAYEAAGGYDTGPTARPWPPDDADAPLAGAARSGRRAAAGQAHPLLRRWDLPTRLPWDGAADYLARDKKRGGDGITVAVAERAGQGRLLTVPLAALMEDV